MMQKIRFGRVVVGLLLMSFGLALSAPAYAGRGGFGGGGMGMSGGGMGMSGGSFGGGGFHGGMGMGGSGFRGSRGGFASSGFHGGRSFHGHKFHGHRCCVNGVFFTGFAFGGGFAPYYYPYPDYWYPPYPYMPYPYSPYVPDLDVSLPGVQASPSMPRESCFPSGCYRLQGDGVTVPYQWVWVPAAPAPPPPPAASTTGWTRVVSPTGPRASRGCRSGIARRRAPASRVEAARSDAGARRGSGAVRRFPGLERHRLREGTAAGSAHGAGAHRGPEAQLDDAQRRHADHRPLQRRAMVRSHPRRRSASGVRGARRQEDRDVYELPRRISWPARTIAPRLSSGT